MLKVFKRAAEKTLFRHKALIQKFFPHNTANKFAKKTAANLIYIEGKDESGLQQLNFFISNSVGIFIAVGIKHPANDAAGSFERI